MISILRSYSLLTFIALFVVALGFAFSNKAEALVCNGATPALEINDQTLPGSTALGAPFPIEWTSCNIPLTDTVGIALIDVNDPGRVLHWMNGGIVPGIPNTGSTLVAADYQRFQEGHTYRVFIYHVASGAYDYSTSTISIFASRFAQPARIIGTPTTLTIPTPRVPIKK